MEIMPKKRGPGRPKKRGRPKGKKVQKSVRQIKKEVKVYRIKPLTQKQRIIAKAKASRPHTVAQIQQEKRMISKKPPTRTINMHGSLYTLYDEKARSKNEAQKIRQKLKSQGKAAFLNPRKRKAGTQWFIYQKARVKVSKVPSQLRISKRTGIPTNSINMHGKKYDLYDEKPRSKSEAQVVRKKLIIAGKAAFLNPRRRKSGIQYFVYSKQAERRLKASPKKSISPRKTAYKTLSKTIRKLEAELRRLKRDN